MNRSSCSAWVLMILIGWCAPGLAAEDGDQAPAEDPTGNKAASWLMEHAKLEALWYLHYGWGEEEDVPFNAFRVSRGYTTIKFKLTDWFRVRSTVDLYEDDDGWDLRFKYLYGPFVLPLERPRSSPTRCSNSAWCMGSG